MGREKCIQIQWTVRLATIGNRMISLGFIHPLTAYHGPFNFDVDEGCRVCLGGMFFQHDLRTHSQSIDK